MLARLHRLPLLAACLLAASAGAQTCEAPGSARRAESARFNLYYAPVPAISVNQHFGLDVLVCPKAPVAGAMQLRVDARMPAHQHGMNYKPTVSSSAPGKYRAEGLMFHMPGRWELMFEVEAGGLTDKLAQTVNL